MKRFLGVLALLALGAAPLRAQSLDAMCAAIGDLTVGHWAEYQVTSPQIPGGSVSMRFAIVGSEAVGGTEHFWQETSMRGAMGDIVIQMLIPGYPNDDGDIARMVMKQGQQPAMEMPQQMIAMMRQNGAGDNPARAAAAECAAATVVGTETLTVPAGTFETMHVRPPDASAGDLWLDPAVPFAIVRFTDPDGSVMALMAHGTDAESLITETPQKMPGM